MSHKEDDNSFLSSCKQEKEKFKQKRKIFGSIINFMGCRVSRVRVTAGIHDFQKEILDFLRN